MAYAEQLANRVRGLLTARPLRGFVTIAPDGLKGHALRHRVALVVDHAETQPPKQPKRKALKR